MTGCGSVVKRLLRESRGMIGKNGSPENREASVLEGIVVPNSWDENGCPTQYSLFTFDEREYRIDPLRARGPDVSAYVRRIIKVAILHSENDERKDGIIVKDIIE